MEDGTWDSVINGDSITAAGFKFDEHIGIDHAWTLSEAYCARSWWPSKDDPSDKADSVDILVTVPSDPDFIVASNGILQSTIIENGEKIIIDTRTLEYVKRIN
mgnify:CR=1 FL=1